MPGLKSEDITRMGWDELQGKLQATTTRGGKGGAGDAKALRDYYGDEEFEELQKLAQRTRAMRAAPKLGNIILLPGIMGSNLSSDDDLIWVNLFKIILGRVGLLRLSEDGSKEANTAVTIRATVVDKRTYTRAVLKLGGRWNVTPFPFDWRKDIDESAKALNKFILENFEGKPVHLVAHSMGGLVARNFIHKYRQTWDNMQGGDGSQGGRLIMMGTPNYGSFTIPQVMTGSEKLVRWLSKLDLSHSATEILQIINSFVGSYQMLPSPAKLPDPPQLYRKDLWGDFPVSEKHLNRAKDFHEGLRDPATINPERMTYIAGCNRETLSGVEISGPGEFTYTTTYSGDGRVPFTLGLLENVKTYYVEEDHGSLPKNYNVISAVDELLQHGTTSVLSEQPVVTRSLTSEGTRWHRSIGEHQIATDLERIAKDASRNQVTPDEQRAAEETLLRAVMGETRPEMVLEQVKEDKKERPDSHRRREKRKQLKITVLKGDVRQIETPVVVAGQYKNTAPINALGALDQALGFWISQAGKKSMMSAELGHVFFIPVRQKQIAAESLLLAGMGEEGKFTRYDLRYLMSNVTYAISALDEASFATLLIGSGAGNLNEEDAIRNLLFGICDALHRLPPDQDQKLREIQIIERDPTRYNSIFKTLDKVKTEDSAGNLDIEVSQRELPDYKTRGGRDANERPPDLPKEEFGPRITIERDRATNVFRFSAMTRDAVIPVREVEIQGFFSDGISERLMASTNRDEQLNFGKLLNTTLIPEDFQQLLNTDKPLTLILDQNTASFPWEMTCFETHTGPAFFGTNLKLTRQFRTLLSGAPGLAPPLNDTLRVLVIADPAPEPDYQLPGARREGREVVKLLNRIKQDWNLNIDVVDRIGDAECDPVEILALILEGGFDMIHYAGHGYFDQDDPSRGGWVFGKDRFLTSREIFRARRVPRIIFANACFSAVVNQTPISAEGMNRHLAGIAEAFFERGVQNYIGSGWPVQDDAAVDFAKVFYSNALTGQTLVDLPTNTKTGGDETSPDEELNPVPKNLAESLSVAREAILHNGSTWGAYHHYGRANDLLITVTKKSSPSEGGARSRSRASAKAEGARKSARSTKSARRARSAKRPASKKR